MLQKCYLVPAHSARETSNHKFYNYTGVWTSSQYFISDILAIAVDPGALDGAWIDCKHKYIMSFSNVIQRLVC